MTLKSPIGYGVFILIVIVSSALMSFGQQSVTKTDAPAASSTSVPRSVKIKRWFELDTFAVSTRYRHLTNNVNVRSTDVMQYQVQVRGRFKFDAKGKYSVTAGVYTGNRIDVTRSVRGVCIPICDLNEVRVLRPPVVRIFDDPVSGDLEISAAPTARHCSVSTFSPDQSSDKSGMTLIRK